MSEANMKTSLFGKGFVGGKYAEMYPEETEVVERSARYSPTENILYMRSTIHNHHPKEGDLFLDVDTNLIHFLEVLEANSGRDIVFNLVSSWFVYGSTTLPANEETSYCNPKGFYSITARAREQLLISYAETFGIKYRILRLGNVIGIGDKKASPKKNAAQWMIKELAQGRDVHIYDSDGIRDFIDVRDCAKAINIILKNGELNTIYNVSNGQGLRVSQMLEVAKAKAKHRAKVRKQKTPEFLKKVQPTTMWLDTTKLQELGYEKEYDIYTTVENLVRYYEANEK